MAPRVSITGQNSPSHHWSNSKRWCLTLSLSLSLRIDTRQMIIAVCVHGPSLCAHPFVCVWVPSIACCCMYVCLGLMKRREEKPFHFPLHSQDGKVTIGSRGVDVRPLRSSVAAGATLSIRRSYRANKLTANFSSVSIAHKDFRTLACLRNR